MQRRFELLQACGLAVLFAAAGPKIAAAQQANANANNENNNEIIVTATHREQSIHDVPFSVNAQTQEDIQRTGSTNLEDLSRNVAGLSVQNLGPGQSQVSIRGVSAGQIVRDQPGVKEQVGIYLDESVMSLSLFTPDIDLYDLNRVETLRGPQGTLFGSGSVGGTIRYITNQPNPDHFEGSIQGDVNTVQDGSTGGSVRGMINAPFGSGAALRAVAYYTAYPGFIDAHHLDGSISDNVNDGHRAGGRIAATFHLGENFTITPRILYQEIDVNGFNREEVFNMYGNAFTTPPVDLGERAQLLLLGEEFRDRTGLADLTANWNLGATTLTSVTSYTNRDILVSRDASALTGSVSVDLAFPTAAALLPSNLRDTTKLAQFTQELRLASNASGPFGPFRWLIGAYYSNADRDYAQRLPTPGYDAYVDAKLGAGTSAGADNGFGLVNNPYHADLPYNDRQFALFGEGSLDITANDTVTLGTRYYSFEEVRRFHSGGLFSNSDDQTDTTSSEGFSPRLLVSHHVNDDLIINAQIAKGFRLGGSNDPLNILLCSPADALTYGGHPRYNDEISWNNEVGFKYQHGVFTLNSALFYNRIENLQVSADAGSCSSRVVFNVPRAHTFGLEAEMTAMPIHNLEISLAGSVVQAEFDSNVETSGGAVIAGMREGNRLASTPNYQLAATAAYYWDAAWAGQGAQAHMALSAQTMGSRFTQPGDQEPGAGVFVSHLAFNGATGFGATNLDLELAPFTIVNFNVGVENDRWGAQVYVNNITDENAHLSFDRERGGRARLGFETNQPRTIGVTVHRNF